LVLRGKHGDHIGGERQAAAALSSGKADAACYGPEQLCLSSKACLFRPGATQVLASTPLYDHCI
jgi:hypothetical protein